MLYNVKFSGIQYPMDTSFTPEFEELVLCEIKGEYFLGKAYYSVKAKVTSVGRIMRPIYDKEKGKIEDIRKDEEMAYQFCNKRIEYHKLPMKIVGVDREWDKKRFKFYFLANKRVDFRKLVKDLKEQFNVTIELRHIGVRDYAGYLGGIGLCGKEVCCSTYLTEKLSVSLEVAKDQDIYVNPYKISGPCGRLLCCLAYERKFYEERKKEFPQRGDEIINPKGKSTVLHRNMLTEVITLVNEDDTQEEISLNELKRKGEKWIRIPPKE
ncbi:stage 0 sporulation protein [candidate division WOR-3 bacterium]|nr:stage 0 sporulation protein [candidate division WOR-3 bacterium]MCK4528971.1 stage 0 sporulation protein [candidate division WOR-3 bacterium]